MRTRRWCTSLALVQPNLGHVGRTVHLSGWPSHLGSDHCRDGVHMAGTPGASTFQAAAPDAHVDNEHVIDQFGKQHRYTYHGAGRPLHHVRPVRGLEED